MSGEAETGGEESGRQEQGKDGFDWTNYEKQGPLTPVMYVAYRKKNFYISILFHCICNLFSTVSFIWMVLG